MFRTQQIHGQQWYLELSQLVARRVDLVDVKRAGGFQSKRAYVDCFEYPSVIIVDRNVTFQGDHPSPSGPQALHTNDSKLTLVANLRGDDFKLCAF